MRLVPELPLLHQAPAAPEVLAPGVRWALAELECERLRFRGLRAGEAFTVRDAAGDWWRARLLDPVPRPDVGATAPCAVAFEALPCPESPVAVALFQAVLDRERMFWVIQKATELGVDWIVPIFTERSLGEADLAGQKAHRWPAAILRAVKQCRRGTVPVLHAALTLTEALQSPLWREAKVRWGMVERPDSPPSGDLATSIARYAALAVGPEGGWAPAEVRELRDAGATPATFGGRILRAETAAIVGLTLLQHLYGDLRTY